MRKHRRHSGILSAGLAVIGLALFLCLPAAEIPEVHAEEAGPDVYGESYCVIDGNTGEILISKNAHERLYPASTTKILTALLVLENVQNLNQYMTFTPTAINIDPSSSTLDPKAKIGERMTVKDALYGMLLKSANECGAMLGEFVAGSEAAFAAMMNARAAEIGARDSHFMNAYGIHHPDQYTTAYDAAQEAQALSEHLALAVQKSAVRNIKQDLTQLSKAASASISYFVVRDEEENLRQLIASL